MKKILVFIGAFVSLHGFWPYSAENLLTDDDHLRNCLHELSISEKNAENEKENIQAFNKQLQDLIFDRTQLVAEKKEALWKKMQEIEKECNNPEGDKIQACRAAKEAFQAMHKSYQEVQKKCVDHITANLIAANVRYETHKKNVEILRTKIAQYRLLISEQQSTNEKE